MLPRRHEASREYGLLREKCKMGLQDEREREKDRKTERCRCQDQYPPASASAPTATQPIATTTHAGEIRVGRASVRWRCCGLTAGVHPSYVLQASGHDRAR